MLIGSIVIELLGGLAEGLFLGFVSEFEMVPSIFGGIGTFYSYFGVITECLLF